MTRALLLLAVAVAGGTTFRTSAADVFSPGDLSRAHSGLSGLDHCTQCHPAGQQLSQQRCLDCHKELAPRVADGKGFHGRLAVKERDCWTCHHEHQGRDFPLVDWGSGGQRRFDHARTGVILSGRHAQAACEKCHDARLVVDPVVKALVAKQPARRTFLGAPAMASCTACHADVHRGELGSDCKRCHGENAWKPAPGFDHARTEYPLTGKHAAVACAKCHPTITEGAADTAAREAQALHHVRYRPVPHASCLDCHKDVHDGRLGSSCAQCHRTDDWRKMASEAPVAQSFHDRTRYPLRGKHAEVRCVTCHGPFPGEPARFKGLPFDACTDCHLDAHVGQLARRSAASAECNRCHDVQGFKPARFGAGEHDATAYRLEGAHRVVACARCHPPDAQLAERIPAAIRAEMARRGRPLRISHAVYAIAGRLDRCETCHEDPHAGQLPRADGCASCHRVDSFRDVRFDHATSRFPLSGKHATTRCGACHRTETIAAGKVVRYRPLDLACSGCHADPHAAQFATTAPAGSVGSPTSTDCARCHSTTEWKKTSFRHEPPFTTYLLTGRHRTAACEKCHPAIQVAPGVAVRRYRPLPRACERCHADFHKGAFQGFEPRSFGR